MRSSGRTGNNSAQCSDERNSTALADIKTAAVEPLSSFNEACVGTSDPYNATRITSEFSASSELIFFANGGDDLTLLVIAPDGSAACSDDFAGSRNPLVSFDDIQTGAYEVYLGTYGGGEVQGTVYAGLHQQLVGKYARQSSKRLRQRLWQWHACNCWLWSAAATFAHH